jgi:hypothetical protein
MVPSRNTGAGILHRVLVSRIVVWPLPDVPHPDYEAQAVVEAGGKQIGVTDVFGSSRSRRNRWAAIRFACRRSTAFIHGRGSRVPPAALTIDAVPRVSLEGSFWPTLRHVGF